ncbi:molybdenum cofactor guanylyltransferase [Halolamina salifodinae]|uniref:Probable molybdenum cofactor guanylyltransferase n=1 Tax=Halolamina salifodinae TaxID=1202767 RepID=A0A8T4GXH9_9EURY|nr:molybdenum cofactor guanylyltransferase [Halolamina salifodinae]MBP1987717.1 molybdopterin-guanine dinucleotide biosynthesis protein A [Halolamina salifodinae]
MHSAVIIAGGRSTRFGDDDKAVAPLAGTPMIRRVADRLEPVVDELVVNCRADQREAIENAMEGYPLPTTYALDPETDQGPMAGIRNGCRAAEGEYVAVVACDMPFVDPETISYLFDRASGEVPPPEDADDGSSSPSSAIADDEGEPPFDGAVPRLGDGWYQTTQAVYRPDAMAAACDAALERGDRKILAPLEDLSYAVVSEQELEAVTDLSSFENLNTQAEFEEAAERLS